MKDVVVSGLVEAERVTNFLASDNWNVYFGVNPRVGRGGRGSVATAAVCHVDLDGMEYVPAALDLYGASGIYPSATVFSGNGAHFYWLLTEHTEDVDAVERVNAGLAEMVHADSCWDSTRVLRVPGTTNFPNRKKAFAGRKPVPCTLHDLDETRRYTVGELQAVAPEVNTTTSVCYVAPPKDVDPLTDEEIVAFDPYVFQHLNDRSAADWALAVRMFNKGAAPDVVYRAIWNSPWSSKAHERGFKYLQYTVAKALRHTTELNNFIEAIVA